VEALNFAQLVPVVVSLLAVAISLIAIRRTSEVQRQQLRLQSLQEAGLRRELSVRLVQSELYRLETARIYAFRISIANHSDAGNSVRDVRLRIAYRRDASSPPSNVTPSHRPELAQRIVAAQAKPLELPRFIAGRDTIGGLVLFEVPAEVLRDASVESYRLDVIDTYDEAASMDIIVVSERPL
jgi:hypothetical protein